MEVVDSRDLKQTDAAAKRRRGHIQISIQFRMIDVKAE